MSLCNPFPTVTGRGRFFHADRVQDGSWGPEGAFEGPVVTMADGTRVPVSDRDDRLGFVFRSPDSGTRMTGFMVALDPGEPDPVGMPTTDEARRTAFAALQPLFESVSRGETDPEDLDFARHLFEEPACLLRTIQRTGELDAARTAVLRDVFRVG